MKAELAVCCSVCGAFVAQAISVSTAAVSVVAAFEPAQPAPNVLAADAHGNYDFERGLSGWINAFSNELACVAAPGRGKALSCSVRNHKARRNVTLGLLKKGRRYVLSCRICPSKGVSTMAIPGGGSGLECGLTIFSKDYKRVMTIGCYGSGEPQAWHRLASEPAEIPEWASVVSLTAGLSYSKGSGLVDDIQLKEADVTLTVNATAPAGIREVKVVDAEQRTIYYADTAEAGRQWTASFPIDDSEGIAVYVRDANGDIGCWRQRQ